MPRARAQVETLLEDLDILREKIRTLTEKLNEVFSSPTTKVVLMT